MAIREIIDQSIPRWRIGFFEEDPPNNAIDDLNDYEVCRLNESNIENVEELSNVAAVIFRQDPDKPTKIERHLEHNAKTLLCHDCQVFVVPVRGGTKRAKFREIIVNAIDRNNLPCLGLSKEEANLQIDSVKYDNKLTPTVHILDVHSKPWTRVANILQDCLPGKPPFLGLKLEPVDEHHKKINLTSEQEALIQRAFHDCSDVKLISNPEGRSGVCTYRAFAVRKSTGEDLHVSSQQPYQFFVKLGERKQIAKEYTAYRDISLEHIPFHLGPRLRLDRCALGAEQGIIVCDYVSDSEKLLECARDGRAVPVIASLFNTTLRAWLDGSSESQKPLQDYLRDRMPDSIPKQRAILINEIEPSKSPKELKNLLEQNPSTPVLIGVIHGDLHSLNVLVRGVDAILIDFEKVETNKPLLLDLASLEAGIFVDGFVGERRCKQVLLESIETLYEVNYLVQHEKIKTSLSDESAWFFDCIRQIRMQAREIEQNEGQYALTLAVELAKKACKKNLIGQNKSNGKQLTVDDVRSLAYILSQRILTKLSQHESVDNSE